MLTVLLNWLYVMLTASLLGIACAAFINKGLCYRIRSFDCIVSMGLIAATVYAQFWSLAANVGVLANLVLIVLCILSAICNKKEIRIYFAKLKKHFSIEKTIILIILIFVWSYCTSRGYMHYDSDLYHAQSIRWIEEYGVVKGLGNIHVRFAYNSSFFALSALYSMPYLFGQSMHSINGFFALLLSVEALKVVDACKRKKFLLSDFARLAALFYLTLIYKEIVAPASDYAIMCTVFYIIIKWLAQLEHQESDNIAPYALLCVGGVYAVSLKLTAGLILLITLKPAIMLLKGRKWKETGIYLSLGIIVLMPWLIRTVIISGYLLYPFPSLDIFNVDWKIPADAAALDAAEIKTWGRGLNNAALVDMPIIEWFPQWFNTTLPSLGKLLIVTDILSLMLGGICGIVSLLHRCFEKMKDTGLIWLTIAVSYIFWQISAPLLRYGYAYVLLLIAITMGRVWIWLRQKMSERLGTKTDIMFVAVLSLLGMVKLFSLGSYMLEQQQRPYYIRQQDYGIYELDSYEVNNVTFYYPVNGDQVGYESFPAIQRKIPIIFRGDTIEQGFRAK